MNGIKIPWIENNIPLKDWAITITVTAQLLDYKVGFGMWRFNLLYDQELEKVLHKSGVSWCISIENIVGNKSYITISFINNVPYSLKLEISHTDSYFSKNIEELSTYQKIIEEWIT